MRPWMLSCPGGSRVWSASQAFPAAPGERLCRTSARTVRRSPAPSQPVTALDRQSGEVGTLRGTDCRFGYRTSRFKSDDVGRFVVCEVTYELKRCSLRPCGIQTLVDCIEREGIRSPNVADVRDAVLLIRRTKGMVLDASDSDTRSVGSFFMNPIVEGGSSHHGRLMSAAGPAPGFATTDGSGQGPGRVAYRAGGFAKGYGSGEVGLSSKHPLAIVNRGGATARDVVALARQIKQQVADRFDVWLRPEPTFVGFGDDADVAYLLGNAAAEAATLRNAL